MKVYLWESLCAVFPNRESLKRYKIKNWRDLLLLYIFKKKNTKYLNYVLDNQETAKKTAQACFKLRMHGIESLLNPRDFETFYE